MREKGQALVETLLVLPLFILFLLGITFFARIFICWIILTQTARHGVFLIVYANYNENQVKEEIVNYLNKEKHLLAGIKKENINVDLGIKFHGPAWVKIDYQLEIPQLLKRIPGFPNPFILSARSECYNDSWYFGFPNNRSRS